MSDKSKMAKHTKVGSRSFGKVKNPDFVIQELLDDKVSRKKLESYYSIESEGDSELFLEAIGEEKRILKKGGVVDIDRTAREVLRDWQNGLIR
jgi:ribosome biogenesis GTPase A